MFFSRQRSAACDKLTGGWTSYEDEYQEAVQSLITGPMSASTLTPIIDAWADQIRPSVIEAADMYGDAVTVSQWESELQELKDQLQHARKN